MSDLGARAEGPVFIIGAPRSGSTILAWALGRHQRLWTGGELHLLWGLFGSGRLASAVQREVGFPGLLERAGITGDDWMAAMGKGIEELLLERGGGARWVDQTPVNTFLADELSRMFPGARFLHVLRDGRLVVRSMLGFDRANPPEVVERLRRGGFWPKWADDFDEACRTWATSVEAAGAFGEAHPDRTLTVRQEAIRATPMETFAHILAFLGLEHEDGPGRYARGTQINTSFKGDRPDDDPAAIEAGWTGSQRRSFEKLAGEAMERWVRSS